MHSEVVMLLRKLGEVEQLGRGSRDLWIWQPLSFTVSLSGIFT